MMRSGAFMNAVISKSVLTLALVGVLVTPLAYAGSPLRIAGKGEKMEIMPTSVPASMKEGYGIMVNACLGCHGQERLLQPILDCRDEKHVDEYCVRDLKLMVMRNLRRPGVDLNRNESKKLIEFMLQLRDITPP